VIEMAIAEMIVPGLRLGPPHDRRPDSNSISTGDTASWSVWGTTAYVTVADPAALPAARRLVSRQFAATEKAAFRFRRGAELHKLYRAGGRPITVSPILTELISAALLAAERTDGDVDPTVGAAMTAVHSGRRLGGRDRSGVPTCGSRPTLSRPVPGWQQVDLQGRRLQVPAGTTLDLSATAKAVACDQAAARVWARLGVGVLVGLGGDAASAGPAPEGGWRVMIEDRTGNRYAEVTLPAGAALATSHFTARTQGTEPIANSELGPPGHLIDPHTGREPTPVWRMASAIGFSSLEAATYTSAALVRGTSARAWLTQLWVPARLITVQDNVITVGPWDAHVAGHPTAPVPNPRLANPRRTTL
jgi:thiamine biosynthesis lipoprotein